MWNSPVWMEAQIKINQCARNAFSFHVHSLWFWMHTCVEPVPRGCAGSRSDTVPASAVRCNARVLTVVKKAQSRRLKATHESNSCINDPRKLLFLLCAPVISHPAVCIPGASDISRPSVGKTLFSFVSQPEKFTETVTCFILVAPEQLCWRSVHTKVC